SHEQPHEQPETPQAGQQLPGTPEYGSMEDAANAERERSASFENNPFTEVVLNTPQIRPSVALGLVQISLDPARLRTPFSEQAITQDEARQRRDEQADPFADTSVQLGTSPGGIEDSARATESPRRLPRRIREEGRSAVRPNLESTSEQVRDRANETFSQSM